MICWHPDMQQMVPVTITPAQRLSRRPMPPAAVKCGEVRTTQSQGDIGTCRLAGMGLGGTQQRAMRHSQRCPLRRPWRLSRPTPGAGTCSSWPWGLQRRCQPSMRCSGWGTPPGGSASRGASSGGARRLRPTLPMAPMQARLALPPACSVQAPHASLTLEGPSASWLLLHCAMITER